MKEKLGRMQRGSKATSQGREYPLLCNACCTVKHVLTFLKKKKKKKALSSLVSTFYLYILTMSPLGFLLMGRGKDNPPSSICSLSAIAEPFCPSLSPR